MKKVIWVLLILLLFFIFPAPLIAADLEISCNGNDCAPSSILKLFPDTELWFPGMWKSKIITIRNLDDKDNLLVENMVTNISIDKTDCHFEKKIILSITRLNTNIPSDLIWAGSLYDYYVNPNPIGLKIINPNSVGDFKYIVSFNQESGNECQGKQVAFNLSLQFTGMKVNKNSPDTILKNECLKTKPINAPTLTSALPGKNNVTLRWTKPADLITFYYLTYGTNNNHRTMKNPNIGTKDTNTYTVTGLTDRQPYYFTISAGNGCAIGPISNELSAVPLTSEEKTNAKTSPSQVVLGISTSIDHSFEISSITNIIDSFIPLITNNVTNIIIFIIGLLFLI